QRKSQRARKFLSQPTLKAENPYTEEPDGAGYACAIKLQSGPVRRADRAFGIHLHPVDDGEKGRFLQTELFHRALERTGEGPRRPAVVEPLDFLAPRRKLAALSLERKVLVGDVVDIAAKGIDREDPIALHLGQKAHRPEERRSRRANTRRDRLAFALI